MSTFDKYLSDRLKNLTDYQLSPEETKQISLGQIAEYIFRKISSSKFRRNKLSDTSKDTLREKIERAVEQQEPLYFIFGFGGYKNHWVENHHPNIGWSEVFNIMHMTELLAPIAKVYEPGVFFEYEAESMAIVVGNNYSIDDVNSYEESFRALINHFHEIYLPSNIRFGYLRLKDQYETNSFFYNVGKLIPQKIEELKKLPKEELDTMVKRARFNLKLNGRVDLTKLSKSELYERAIEGVAFNHVFLDEDFVIREEYFEGGNHIPLVGSYVTEAEDPANWLKINSCKRSNISFWTGRGMIRTIDSAYEEDIISVTQFNALKPESIIVEDSALLTDIVKNLNKIEIIN